MSAAAAQGGTEVSQNACTGKTPYICNTAACVLQSSRIWANRCHRCSPHALVENQAWHNMTPACSLSASDFNQLQCTKEANSIATSGYQSWLV